MQLSPPTRSLHNLLGGRPLRIGLNTLQSWWFESPPHSSGRLVKGVIPELCRKLSAILRVAVEAIPVPFDRFVEKLLRGEIDLFGPLMIGAHCPSAINFSIPISKLGLSALMRQRPTAGLAAIPPPESFQDLIDRPYTIAVLKDSRPHLFAESMINRSDESLIACSSDEEAIERVLLKGISRPAHIFLTNSVLASFQARQHPEDLLALFITPGKELELSDNGFAIRPDWTDCVGSINDGLLAALAEDDLSTRLQKLPIELVNGPSHRGLAMN